MRKGEGGRAGRRTNTAHGLRLLPDWGRATEPLFCFIWILGAGGALVWAEGLRSGLEGGRAQVVEKGEKARTVRFLEMRPDMRFAPG